MCLLRLKLIVQVAVFGKFFNEKKTKMIRHLPSFMTYNKTYDISTHMSRIFNKKALGPNVLLYFIEKCTHIYLYVYV